MREALRRPGGQERPVGYYVCGTLFREGSGTCTARYLNATKVENFIIEKVRERILTEETITELVTLVAEEIDNIAGEVNGRLTAISAELADVEARLENLYQALETKQLPIEVLPPLILSLKARQDQLTAAREEAEGQLSSGGRSCPPARKSKDTWQTSGSFSGKAPSPSGRRSSATSCRVSRSWKTRRF